MIWIYGESQPPFIETRKNLGRNQRTVNFNIQKTDGADGFNYRWQRIELEPGIWAYDAIVNAIISAEYPTDRMQAVVNNYLLDQTDERTIQEMQEMQHWRSFAKETAHQAIAEIQAE